MLKKTGRSEIFKCENSFKAYETWIEENMSEDYASMNIYEL